jgi:hypothetical protein
VGVVADAKYHALREPPRPYLYVPLAQQVGTHPFLTQMTLLARAGAAARSLAPAIERELRAAGPAVPIFRRVRWTTWWPMC